MRSKKHHHKTKYKHLDLSPLRNSDWLCCIVPTKKGGASGGVLEWQNPETGEWLSTEVALKVVNGESG